MALKTVLEGAAIGLALQAIIGWGHPLTLVFTGFTAGMVAREERAGTFSGLIIGIVAGLGLAVWVYLGLQVPFSAPASQIIASMGLVGAYITAAAMLVFAVVGGKIGGSFMRKLLEDTYRRGEAVGNLKQLSKQLKKRKGLGLPIINQIQAASPDGQRRRQRGR